MADGHHESLDREPVPTASERSFGWTMAVVFALIALWPLWSNGAPRLWALSIAAIFILALLIRPKVLAPLNRAWLKLGHVLHMIVSPVIMGVLFAIAVVPTGLYLRMTGKDPLRLKFDRDAPTYWIVRDPPGPPSGSLKNQF